MNCSTTKSDEWRRRSPPEMPGLVLSLFPGADLLGRGFELEGFCVVRGPDILWGQDVRHFMPARHAFDGIIGGPPCQDYSSARRTPQTGKGDEMIQEFARVVTQAAPRWFLAENVVGVPNIIVPGYNVQRLNLNAKECGGCKQNRLRCFQFGSRDGARLVIRRSVTAEAIQPCCMASEGTSQKRRSFADFCELMGLPRDFDMPGLCRAAKYRAVGNGVPVPMARVIALAVQTAWSVTERLCGCDCGRTVAGRQVTATPSCRQRMKRRRDAAVVTVPGPVTPVVSRSRSASLHKD